MHDLIGLNMNQLKLKLVGNSFSAVKFFRESKNDITSPDERKLGRFAPSVSKNETVVRFFKGGIFNGTSPALPQPCVNVRFHEVFSFWGKKKKRS